MGSYSSVASLPAYLRMILGPPGCSWKPLDGVDVRCQAGPTWQKLCNIICFAMDNHPARIPGVVLGDLLSRQAANLRSFTLVMVHRDELVLL
jgi:hypothetical protein